VLHSESCGVDPQQKGSLNPVDKLGSTCHVGIGLGNEFICKDQLPEGGGVDSGVGPLILVQMIPNIQSAGQSCDAVHNGHAAHDAIHVLGAIVVACAITVIGIDDSAIGDGSASIVAAGGIGGIAAVLRAIAGTLAHINGSTIRIVGGRNILEYQSEVSKVDGSTHQILEGIGSNLATNAASDREGFSILLSVQTWARSSQKGGVSVDQVHSEVPAQCIEVGLGGIVLDPLIGIGILIDFVDGLEIQVEVVVAYSDFEIGRKITANDYSNGIDLEANISFAEDSKKERKHKYKLEKCFHDWFEG
jgi:hypothetical protein